MASRIPSIEDIENPTVQSAGKTPPIEELSSGVTTSSGKSGILSDVKKYVTDGGIPASGAAMETAIAGAVQAGGNLLKKAGTLAAQPWTDEFTGESNALGQALKTGVDTVAIPTGSAIESAGKTGYTYWDSKAKQWRPAYDTKVGQYVQGASDSIAMMAPGVVLSALTGNPTPALVTMGTLTGGQKFGEMQQGGYSEQDSWANALLQGSSEGLTEVLPMGELLKINKGGFIKALGRYLISEIPNEQLATMIQNSGDKIYFDPKATPEQQKANLVKYWNGALQPGSEFQQDQIDTFFTTLLQGVVMGSGGKIASKTFEHVQNKDALKTYETFVKESKNSEDPAVQEILNTYEQKMEEKFVGTRYESAFRALQASRNSVDNIDVVAPSISLSPEEKVVGQQSVDNAEAITAVIGERTTEEIQNEINQLSAESLDISSKVNQGVDETTESFLLDRFDAIDSRIEELNRELEGSIVKPVSIQNSNLNLIERPLGTTPDSVLFQKIVKEVNERPWYHGTPRKITGTVKATNSEFPYLTHSTGIANGYATSRGHGDHQAVYPFNVNISNPYITTKYNEITQLSRQDIDYLKSAGYDSILYLTDNNRSFGNNFGSSIFEHTENGFIELVPFNGIKGLYSDESVATKAERFWMGESLEGLTTSDRTSVVRNGTSLSYSTEIGNVVSTSESDKNLVEFLDDLSKSVGIDAKVFITSNSELTSNPDFTNAQLDRVIQDQIAKGSENYVVPVGKGKYLVVVNPQEVTDLGVLETYLHEAFGHVTVFEKFHEADEQTQVAIAKDFERFAGKLSSTPEELQQAIREFYPFHIGQDAENFEGFQAYALASEHTGGVAGQEWLANQIVKWATTSEHPRTLAAKWFKGVAEKLKELYNVIMRKNIKEGLPVQSVKEWMDSLFYKTSLENKVERQSTAKTISDVKLAKALEKTIKHFGKEKYLSKFKTVSLLSMIHETVDADGKVWSQEAYKAYINEHKKGFELFERSRKVLADKESTDLTTGDLKLIQYALDNNLEVFAAAEIVNMPGTTNGATGKTKATTKQQRLITGSIRVGSRSTAYRAAEISRLLAVLNFVPNRVEKVQLGKKLVTVDGDKAEVLRGLVQGKFNSFVKEYARRNSMSFRDARLHLITNPRSAVEFESSIEMFDLSNVEDKNPLMTEEDRRAHEKALREEAVLGYIEWYTKEKNESPNLPKSVEFNAVISQSEQEVEAEEAKLQSEPVEVMDKNNFQQDLDANMWLTIDTFKEYGKTPKIESFTANILSKMQLTNPSDKQTVVDYVKANWSTIKELVKQGKKERKTQNESEFTQDELAAMAKEMGVTLEDFDPSIVGMKASDLAKVSKSQQSWNDLVSKWNLAHPNEAAKINELESKKTQYDFEGNVLQGEEQLSTEEFAELLLLQERRNQDVNEQFSLKKSKIPKKKRERKPADEKKVEARKRKEMEKVAEIAKLDEAAQAKNVSLAEYLMALGKEGPEIQKLVTFYNKVHKTKFSQAEQIMRLAAEVGLVNRRTGTNDLSKLIKSIWPNADGTISQLNVSAKNVLLYRLQQQYFAKNNELFDFSKEVDIKTVLREKENTYRNFAWYKRWKIIGMRFLSNHESMLATTPAGSELAFRLKRVHSAQYSLYIRDYLDRLEKLSRKFETKEAREHVLEVYEGRDSARNEAETQMVELMKEIYHTYGQEMDRLQVSIMHKGGYVSTFKYDPTINHFPHMWDDKSFETKKDEMINYLLRTGQVNTEVKDGGRSQAIAILNSFQGYYNRLQSPRYSNMEMARDYDMEGWIRDPFDVTTKYVLQASRRLAVLRELGPNSYQYLVSMLMDHVKQSDDPDSLKYGVLMINLTTGGSVYVDKDTGLNEAVDVAEFVGIALSLQHSAVVQPSVLSNAVGTMGLGNVAKAFHSLYFDKDMSKEEIEKRTFGLGIAAQAAVRDLIDDIQNNMIRDKADKLVRNWGVIAVDSWARGVSAMAARTYIMETLDKAANGSEKAKENLLELGLEFSELVSAFNETEGTSFNDLIKMGVYQAVVNTNFKTTSLTMMPAWHGSRAARLIFMFQRYSFFQHQYLLDMIKSNPKKLGRQLVSMHLVGVPIWFVRLLIKGIDPLKEIEENGWFAAWLSILMCGAGLGFVLEGLISSAVRGQGMGGPLNDISQNFIKGTKSALSSLVNGEDVSREAYKQLYNAALLTTAATGHTKIAAAMGVARPMVETAAFPSAKRKKTSLFE